MIATAQTADYATNEQHGFEAGTERNFGARTLCGQLLTGFSAIEPDVPFGTLPAYACPTCATLAG